jgi:O-antigen/teichoic acid export membrane protein
MEWGADVQFAGAVFGLVVGSKISGTALGVFRLLEDYWAQVYVQLGASCVKVALVLWGVSSGWDIYGFLVAWALSEIVMHLGLIILAFYRYRLHRGFSVFGYGARLRREVVRFMVWTNLAVAADLPAKELDVVLVGVLAGEREAGFYKIAKQGMALVGKLSSPLYQAIYPVQARMLAGKDRSGAIGITLKAASLLLLVSAVLVLVAWPVLPVAVPFVLGGEYGAVWSLFLFAVVVKSLDNVFTTVHSLFVAMGYVRANLVILLVANSVMLAGFWLFVPDFGAFAALSCLAAQAVMVLLMKVLFISSAGKR